MWGSSFNSSIHARSDFSSVSPGRRRDTERMPTFSQARCLLRTYTAEAGSLPTRMTPRPGGYGAFGARRSISARTSARIRSDTGLPRSNALMGPPYDIISMMALHNSGLLRESHPRHPVLQVRGHVLLLNAG